jgi:hypothetical protein
LKRCKSLQINNLRKTKASETNSLAAKIAYKLKIFTKKDLSIFGANLLWTAGLPFRG